jgi:arsenate reductase-like glutaredoxin family protein
MTSAKTQEYLAKHKITIALAENTKQRVLGEKDALKLAGEVDEIYAAKGKKVVHFNLKKEKPGKEELTRVLLGPTGNLRAPAFRIGRKLVVGFDETTYHTLFKIV